MPLYSWVYILSQPTDWDIREPIAMSEKSEEVIRSLIIIEWFCVFQHCIQTCRTVTGIYYMHNKYLLNKTKIMNIWSLINHYYLKENIFSVPKHVNERNGVFLKDLLREKSHTIFSIVKYFWILESLKSEKYES